jgi:hypothetical protein
MTMRNLREWVTQKKREHPKLITEIEEFHQLCKDEIEEGGSEQHEIALCMESIADLISES